MRDRDSYHFPVWMFVILNVAFFFLWWKSGGIKIEQKVENCKTLPEVALIKAATDACEDGSGNRVLNDFKMDERDKPVFTCKKKE